MNLFERYKNIIIILVVAAGFGVIVNTIFSINQKKKEVLLVNQAELRNISELIGKWKIVTEEDKNVRSKFKYTDEAGFKKFVEDCARKFSINIGYFSPTRQEMQFYTELSLILRISAEYQNLVDFFDALEQNDIEIKRLEIECKEMNEKVIEVELQTVLLND